MKNPEETIEKLRKFTENIGNQYFKVNFLFSGGYLMFIEDLGDIAKELHNHCKRILGEHGVHD